MKRGLRDIDLQSKNVVLRCDLNVPMSDGEITDDTRILASLDTIKYLIEKNCKVVILSHLGRPKGEAKSEFSLEKVSIRLSELLNREVKFIRSDNVIDDSVLDEVSKCSNGDIILLENVRFRKEETKNDEVFSKDLSKLGDIFVNDAFGTSHRAHCSTAGISEFLPSVAGELLEREIEFLDNSLKAPKKPFVAVLGGAKVGDKIGVLSALINKVDSLVIGGGMAYTFLKAQGYNIGKSILDEENIDFAKKLLEKAEEKGVSIYLPKDVIVSSEFGESGSIKEVKISEIPEDFQGLDIGSETIAEFSDVLSKAELIFWNGPMGVFEMESFARGSMEVAKAISENKNITIVGGGDSAACVKKFNLDGKFTHISTGGGASLELLEGKELPGVESLMDRRNTMIIGNWKMFKTPRESLSFGEDIVNDLSSVDCEVGFAVPSLDIPVMVQVMRDSKVLVGAQNVFYEDEGAFTGEISPNMIKSIGCDFCIVGHSERRQYFKETDEDINKKLKKLISHNIRPILCVGESLETREADKQKKFVRNQLDRGLEGLSAEDISTLVIAYEPIWAIGTGKTATPKEAEDMCKFIRDVIMEKYGVLSSERLIIQYGGSVKPSNIAEIMEEKNIDGALVGGASLKREDFLNIVTGGIK